LKQIIVLSLRNHRKVEADTSSCSTAHCSRPTCCRSIFDPTAK